MHMQVEDGVVYRVGDTVRVEEDKEKVSREQKAHGGRRDEVAEVYYTHNSSPSLYSCRGMSLFP